jgi:hypothetical protein
MTKSELIALRDLHKDRLKEYPKSHPQHQRIIEAIEKYEKKIKEAKSYEN